MPGSRQEAAKLDWQGQSCVGRDGHPFKNVGSRVTCRECDLAKGACFGKNVAKAVEVRKQGAGTTLAERQLHLKPSIHLLNRLSFKMASLYCRSQGPLSIIW